MKTEKLNFSEEEIKNLVEFIAKDIAQIRYEVSDYMVNKYQPTSFGTSDFQLQTIIFFRPTFSKRVMLYCRKHDDGQRLYRVLFSPKYGKDYISQLHEIAGRVIEKFPDLRTTFKILASK